MAYLLHFSFIAVVAIVEFVQHDRNGNGERYENEVSACAMDLCFRKLFPEIIGMSSGQLVAYGTYTMCVRACVRMKIMYFEEEKKEKKTMAMVNEQCVR